MRAGRRARSSADARKDNELDAAALRSPGGNRNRNGNDHNSRVCPQLTRLGKVLAEGLAAY